MSAEGKSRRSRIALVSSSLQAGGAERALSTLANYWATIGHDVTVITLDAASNDFYRLDHGVSRVALNLLRPSMGLRAKFSSNLARFLRLRSELVTLQPNVIVSFVDQTNILTLVATIGLAIPVIVSERIDPRFHEIGRTWRLLRALIYPRAQAVVVQSDAVREWASHRVASQRIHVIPNTVRTELIQTIQVPAGHRGQAGTVLAVGRLDAQKGFDILLRAFAHCSVQESGWTLTILGEGPERGRLQEQAAHLGIAEHVSMPGVVENVASEYRKADIFVLSSRYEGFPNVLLEAMSHGCAVVSFNCPSGPADIISDGSDGILVPAGSVEELAEAILQLMRSDTLRRDLARRAIESMQRYAPDTVMPMWDRLLASAMS